MTQSCVYNYIHGVEDEPLFYIFNTRNHTAVRCLLPPLSPRADDIFPPQTTISQLLGFPALAFAAFPAFLHELRGGGRRSPPCHVGNSLLPANWQEILLILGLNLFHVSGALKHFMHLPARRFVRARRSHWRLLGSECGRNGRLTELIGSALAPLPLDRLVTCQPGPD